MAWVREGECNRCGSCCRYESDGRLEREIGPQAVAGMCPLFRWADAARTVGVCSDRSHPHYKRGCDVWPDHPHCIEPHPRCSFTFRWVD